MTRQTPELFDGRPRYGELLVVAAAVFILCLYMLGLRAMNPFETTWMLDKDPAQHYLGWVFFRYEAWQIPPGRILGFGIPEGSSIVFTDSIPLLALPFKLVSAWLPRDFQYFGLWMAACFFLNGYFGLKIMARLTSSTPIRILSALFFVASPPLLLRATGHESLMAQWLILAGIEAHMVGWQTRRWLAITVMAALCHAYLLLMVVGQMAAAMVSALWIDKSRRPLPLARDVLLIFVCVGCSMWTAGYFCRNSGVVGASGYGLYSMNVLSLVDPLLKWSRIIQARPIHPRFAVFGEYYGQYEGFLYLGTGMLVLAVMALALVLEREKKIFGKQGLLPTRWLPLAGVAVVFWFMALSNDVMVSDVHILHIPLNQTVLNYLSIFRASGRLGWVAFYALTLAILVIIVRRLPRRAASCILLAMLALHVGDQYRKYTEIRQFVASRFTWRDPLASPAWAAMAGKAQKLVILPPHPPMASIYLPFARLASTYHLQTNAAYEARNDDPAIMAYGNQVKDGLAAGDYDTTTMYVFLHDADAGSLPDRLKEQLEHLDGYVVLPPGLGNG